MIGEAVSDRRSGLEALRDYYAACLDEGPPARDVAAIGRRLESVLAELEALKEPDDVDALDDELARKRADRLADTGS